MVLMSPRFLPYAQGIGHGNLRGVGQQDLPSGSEAGGDATKLDVRQVKLEGGANDCALDLEDQGLWAALDFPQELLLEVSKLTRTERYLGGERESVGACSPHNALFLLCIVIRGMCTNE